MSWTSQRGVTPTHWGGVLVVLESWRACDSGSVRGGVASAMVGESYHGWGRVATNDGRSWKAVRTRASAAARSVG